MSAQLQIGTRLVDGEAATLLPRRLNRHTFWCGQSGSGKTYALGVLLEQVMLRTRLPVVVLDPNSDFVHLGTTREDVPAEPAGELANRNIRVLRRTGEGDDRLRVSYIDMDVRSRAAILQLDPVVNAEEYNVLLQLGADKLALVDRPLVEWLRATGNPRLERVAMRLENLGVAEWDMWAWGERSVTDVVDERADATVVDLGAFDTAAEMQAAALAVLDHLWVRRHERVGRLVVIDEAHNLCSPAPSTPLERLLTDRIIQIAAEGRKFGIWLLLSTQRPSKVHPNVISQCDNLALMRMSSAHDLDGIARIFGFAPEELVRRSPSFAQGQALFAGGFAAEPQLVQMADRLTLEGGSDVPVELR